MKTVLRQGKLTTWKDDRGFGFIRPSDGSPEVFLHISELKDSTRRPKVGDIIYYYPVEGDGKVRACRAFILGARHKLSSTTSANTRVVSRRSSSSIPFMSQMVLFSVLPLTGASHLSWTIRNPLPLFVYFLMSLVTFVLYADDKSRATRGQWRIPEKILHLCEWAGGWAGGLVAQHEFRHKSSKRSYQQEFWLIVWTHHIAWFFWFLMYFKGSIAAIMGAVTDG